MKTKLTRKQINHRRNLKYHLINFLCLLLGVIFALLVYLLGAKSVVCPQNPPVYRDYVRLPYASAFKEPISTRTSALLVALRHDLQ